MGYINNRFIIRKVIIFVFLSIIILISCGENDVSLDQESGFLLTSSEIKADSLLPEDYTCDGASATLPLEWSGEPEGTVAFALIMHHEATPTDIHWYWVLYNIPSSVHFVPKNVSGIGTLGTNSVNDRNEYSPPCSQGPGLKAYIYTIYALSEDPVINIPQSDVTREVLLNSMKNITLSSSKMRVYYSRILEK